MSKSTLEQIIDLAARHFNKKADTMSGETHLINDLKGDSLDAVEMIMNIEDHFELEIPEDELDGVRTLGGIADVVGRHLAK
jgi:acyl carrier protein